MNHLYSLTTLEMGNAELLTRRLDIPKMKHFSAPPLRPEVSASPPVSAGHRFGHASGSCPNNRQAAQNEPPGGPPIIQTYEQISSAAPVRYGFAPQQVSKVRFPRAHQPGR